jgi:plastocyanin
MRLFRPCLLIFFLGLTTACGSSGGSSTPTTPTPTPTTPAPAPATGTQNVSIVVNSQGLGPNAYNPSPVTIAAGTTVRWTNNDTITHTSTSNTGVWSSGNLQPGGTFDFTFQTSGTFTYHCAIHPGMTGTVVVQ